MRLAEVLPADVRVRIVADRGFRDRKLYRMLTEELRFDFVIRFRSNIIDPARVILSYAAYWNVSDRVAGIGDVDAVIPALSAFRRRGRSSGVPGPACG